MTVPSGYLCLVLHAHLPFVRHPEHEQFLEERWLFEAITETYIPLLGVYEGLLRDRIDFRVTMTLSPPLVSMLTDQMLQDRYARHLARLVDLADKEIDRTRPEPAFHRLALHYRERFETARATFDRCGRDLVSAFRHVQDAGPLEIVTSTATHAFLPLMDRNWAAIRAQVHTACDLHERRFGRRPAGIWLGECGYVRGVDEVLREAGLRYFFVDTHGIMFADRRPVYGVHAPVYCPAGVAAFGRDAESSKQVWSAEEGYPGDPWYRDFYRDVGFDREEDYIRPYIQPDGTRVNTGIKYHRITNRQGSPKEPYDPDAARELAARHAGNFMFNRERQVEWLAARMDRGPIVVSPYDAELFGHWWYEGPQFLDFLFRKMACDQRTVEPITPSEYLVAYPTNQVATPCTSSWGFRGYAEVWLNGSNDWTYRHLHEMSERMNTLARRFPSPDALTRRALNQAAREVMLAQSSDWAFIMKTGTTVPYATRRTCDAVNRFHHLHAMVLAEEIDEQWLADLEARDAIFPDVDYRVYAR